MAETAESVPVNEASGGVGLDGEADSTHEKRPIEDSGCEELGVLCNKKAKVEAASSRALKRVAEIVLVLSTMSTMRGGRNPTAVEVELMKEARAKLVEVCKGLAPKEIVAREAIETVIDDLGLNGKIKDQKLGIQTPKLTVAERFSLSKRKMEESRKFPAHSPTYTSQPLQTSFASTAEGRGSSHNVHMHASDKSSPLPVASGTVPYPSPVVHVSTGGASSLQYQTPSTVSSRLPSTLTGTDLSSPALPRTEQPQIKRDGGSNGPSYVQQVQANSSSNQPLVNAPTWSIQTQSATLARNGPERKMPSNSSFKVEESGDPTSSRVAPQAARDQTFRPYITQTASGNFSTVHQPMQGMNIVQSSSLSSNHIEIAKVIQKLLQPKVPDHPSWTPPSRDYMTKAMTCQFCEITVNEVDTVLLCDACEKGFHLKCLQPSILRGIPRGEWHCLKCVSLSKGKPLPPKYGRVMRSTNTPPKVASNSSGVQSPSEKKPGSSNPKAIQQKPTVNGNSALLSPNPVGGVKHPTSDPKPPNTVDIRGNANPSNTRDMIEKPFVGPSHNISVTSAGEASCKIPVGQSDEISDQLMKICDSDKMEARSLESASVVPGSSEPATKTSDNLQSSHSLHVNQTALENRVEVPMSGSHGSSLKDKENIDCAVKYNNDQEDQYVSQSNSSQPNTETRQYPEVSSDGLHAVEWIGDYVQVDGKNLYRSILVNGVTYNVQDHALFYSSRGVLTPYKLQSMWEDNKTGLKWVNVKKYCFPSDLAENIGHPSAEANEVYETNNDDSEMAGCIQGPCEVLPYVKFKEETERRRLIGVEAISELRPIFLCQWLYDEFKGIFQPVTS